MLNLDEFVFMGKAGHNDQRDRCSRKAAFVHTHAFDSRVIGRPDEPERAATKVLRFNRRPVEQCAKPRDVEWHRPALPVRPICLGKRAWVKRAGPLGLQYWDPFGAEVQNQLAKRS